MTAQPSASTVPTSDGILLLVDGNSLINRAFYGSRVTLTTPEGKPSSAVYTFLNILLKERQTLGATHLGVMFDRKEKTFRHEFYPDYKAGRKPMPEELATQMPMLKELLGELGVCVLSKAGYEADDLLGTLSLAGEKAFEHVYVLTGDSDSFQLISDKVSIRYASRSSQYESLGPQEFLEKSGCTPEGYVHYKALLGDTSDHVPGVPGIGQKSALELLSYYPTIPELFKHLDELPPKFQKKLSGQEETADFAYRLIKIDRHVPLEYSWDDFSLAVARTGNDARIQPALQQLGFKSLLEKIYTLYPEGSDAAIKAEDRTSTVTGSVAGAGAPAWEPADLPQSGLRGFVEESKDLLCLEFDEAEAKLYLGRPETRIYVALEPGDYAALYIHAGMLGKRLAILSLKPLLKASRATQTEGVIDLAVYAYALGKVQKEVQWENFANDYSLETPMLLPENAGTKERLNRNFSLLVELTALITEQVKARGVQKLIDSVDLPLVSVLVRMEDCGVAVDVARLSEIEQELEARRQTAETEIYRLAGREFNINSQIQLSALLYEELGLKPGKKLKNGYSTSVEELERLKDDHPIIRLILEYRLLAKLLSTFVVGLAGYVAEDGRIHTTFHQNLTQTGRLSSSDPNLQNIPVRREEGRSIRSAFVAEPGKVLIDADYSQIELRLLAHLSGDEGMIEAFRNHTDIHRMTAARIFGVPADEVTGEQRGLGKTINFSIVYGISDFGLAQDLDLSIPQARAYIKGYHAQYPQVEAYLESLIEGAKQNGYVETLLGRRRWIPELKNSRYSIRQFGERAAMNTPIQGTAADMIRLAMIRVAKRLEEEHLDARLVLQIHDELIVEAAESCAEQASKALREEMEGVWKLAVPLEVDVHIGKSWLEAKS